MLSQLTRTSPTCDRATVAGRGETSGRADADADVQFMQFMKAVEEFMSEVDLGVRVDLLQKESRTAPLLRDQNIPRAGGLGERFGDQEEAPHHRASAAAARRGVAARRADERQDDRCCYDGGIILVSSGCSSHFKFATMNVG
jgi:hypothetical protein